MMYRFILFLLPFCWFDLSYAMPPVQLAKVYQEASAAPIEDYLVSEKYDGVRAIWTGEQLLTRQGNHIAAPEWFIAPLPAQHLDGELWTKRQDFATVSGIVRRQQANDADWRKVSYMVFDMPAKQLTFSQRYQNYLQLITSLDVAHIKAVKQQRFSSVDALKRYMQRLVAKGAEGVMLHLATAQHHAGRSNALLKLKPYMDDEAVVIAHLPGKGKYHNMLGALRVRNQQGIEFSIGTGFTDQQRAQPPAIGSRIRYKYHGYTRHGIPRFASFLRVREAVMKHE